MLLIKICEFFITLQTIHNRADPYWACFSINTLLVSLFLSFFGGVIMRNHVRSFKTFIRDEIIKKGGWVNAHAHADRAFTMTPEKIGIYHNSNLQQKWDLVDEFKRTSSVDDYYARFCQSIELMISQGVTAFGTFVDIDPICEDRAIIAAHKAREVYKHDIF